MLTTRGDRTWRASAASERTYGSLDVLTAPGSHSLRQAFLRQDVHARAKCGPERYNIQRVLLHRKKWNSLDVDAVASLELQDLACLVRRGDRQTEPFDDLTRLAHLFLVGGELLAALEQGILQSHAHVAAHGCRHGGDAHLAAPGSQH